ncbi:Uncharacterised protein [Arachnia propionica]|nr:Uncharacterised protein [Arachnia propionica]
MLMLLPLTLKLLRDYDQQRKAGLNPVFDPSKFPEVKGLDWWHGGGAMES